MTDEVQDEGRPMRLYRSDLADELCRWSAAKFELLQARDCLRRLDAELPKPEAERDQVLMMACWDAAVLRATRVFEGKSPLPRAVLQELPEGAEECLDYFVNVRNKHVAHRVNPVDQVKAGIFVLDAPGEGGQLVDGASVFSIVLVQWADPRVVGPLIQFVVSLLKVCAERVMSISEQVREEANRLPESELRSLEVARLVVRQQKHLTP